LTQIIFVSPTRRIDSLDDFANLLLSTKKAQHPVWKDEACGNTLKLEELRGWKWKTSLDILWTWKFSGNREERRADYAARKEELLDNKLQSDLYQ